MELPTVEQVENAQQPNVWNLGNKALYDLCRDNFEHDQDDKIIAKVWLVGRAYSVAVERRKNKTENNDNFYLNKILPSFKKSKIDQYLADIKNDEKLTTHNLQQVLETHCYLTKILNSITNLNKRSFSSKYLHFHLPELFFIYDSRAVSALRHFSSKVTKDLQYLTQIDTVDKEYAKFVCKCFDLKTQIEKRYNITLTGRQLDNILINVANTADIAKIPNEF